MSQYSCSMAILVIFLSNKVLTKIEHIHLSMVVQHIGLCLSYVDIVDKFLISIQQDLDAMRERGSNSQRLHCLFLVNYCSTMAIPTEPPYCLVYHRIYDKEADQSIFNISSSPSTMHSSDCICHRLLHLMDMDSTNVRQCEVGCLLVPCGTQYNHLSPEITIPCNYMPLLIEVNTGQMYHTMSVGNFSLRDMMFTGSLGNSLLFSNADLVSLCSPPTTERNLTSHPAVEMRLGSQALDQPYFQIVISP